MAVDHATRGNAAHLHRQAGSVTLFVLGLMVFLVAAAGLGVEAGRLFVIKAELQTAADACALAAAQRLNCTATDSSCLVAADTAGVGVAALNSADMQSTAVALTASNITYSTALDGAYATRAGGAPNASRYARCSASKSGVVPWILGLVSVGSSTVVSGATATLAPSQSACIAVPLTVCDTVLPAANAWFSLEAVPSSGTPPWKLTDIDGTGASAAQIKALLAGTPTVCNMKVNTSTLQAASPANLNAMRQAYNTRFGVYQGSYSGPSDAVPDYTGYSYPTKSTGGFTPKVTSASAFSAYMAKKTALEAFSNSEFGGGSIPGAGSPFNPASDPSKAGKRRLAIAAVVTCPWVTNNVVKDLACVLMLAPMDNGANPTIWFEYLGSASASGSPCGPFVGTPGPPSGGPIVPTLVQ